jgi:hypothetical protein
MIYMKSFLAGFCATLLYGIGTAGVIMLNLSQTKPPASDGGIGASYYEIPVVPVLAGAVFVFAAGSFLAFRRFSETSSK